MRASPQQPSTYFVIYSVPTSKAKSQVLGMCFHQTGDGAAAKAEQELGVETVLWNAWKNATPAERRQAERLGAIT